MEVVEAESPYGGGGAGGRFNPYGRSRFDEPAAGFQSGYATPGWQRAKEQWSREDRHKPRGPMTLEGELVASSTGRASSYCPASACSTRNSATALVAEVEGNKLTIDFDKAGRKRVVDSFVRARRRTRCDAGAYALSTARLQKALEPGKFLSGRCSIKLSPPFGASCCRTGQDDGSGERCSHGGRRHFQHDERCLPQRCRGSAGAGRRHGSTRTPRRRRRWRARSSCPSRATPLLDRLTQPSLWPDGDAPQARRFMRYLDYWRRHSYSVQAARPGAGLRAVQPGHRPAAHAHLQRARSGRPCRSGWSRRCASCWSRPTSPASIRRTSTSS